MRRAEKLQVGFMMLVIGLGIYFGMLDPFLDSIGVVLSPDVCLFLVGMGVFVIALELTMPSSIHHPRYRSYPSRTKRYHTPSVLVEPVKKVHVGNLEAIKCSVCGAPLEVDGVDEIVKCKYCQNRMKVVD